MSWITTALLMVMACMLAPFQTADAATKQDDLGGAWVGVYQSYPHLVRMTLQLPSMDGQQTSTIDTELRLEPLVELRSITRAPMGVVHVTVAYDSAARTVSLTPSADAYRILGARLPTFIGVLDPEGRLIGGVAGSVASDENPYFVMGRSEIAEATFLKKLKEVALFTQNIAAGAGSILNRFGGAIGDKPLREWANRMSVEYPDVDTSHTAIGALFLKGRNLFRDEYFRPYFGETFDDMSKAELTRNFNEMQKVPLPRSNFPEEKANGVVVSMRHAFFAGPGFGNAQDTRLSVIALRVMSTWRAQALRSLQNATINAEGWRSITGVEAAEKPVFALFWPSERQEFATTVAGARTKVASPLLTKQVEDFLASANSFVYVPRIRTALTAVSNNLARASVETSMENLAPFVPDDMKRGLAARLDGRRTELISAEIAMQVRDATGYEGLQTLLSLDENLRGQLDSSESSKQAANSTLLVPLRAKIKELNAAQAAKETAEYETFANQSTGGLPALVDAKAREAKLVADYSNQLNTPEFAEFNKLRTSYREKWLTSNTSQLGTRINAAQTMSALDEILDQYVVKNDIDSTAAKPLMLVVQQRRAILAPFSDFPGGDYLNAIYDGDAAKVSELDSEYLRSYTKLLQMGGIAGLLRSFTLVQPVLATYMFNYDTASSKCLRPDAREFVI